MRGAGVPKKNVNKSVSPKDVGEENRKRVYLFFEKNPCARNIEAAIELNLSPLAVGRHARAIRLGWRPCEDVVDDGYS